MKKIIISFICILIILSIPAFADENEEITNTPISVFVNKDVKITYNDSILEFFTASQDRVYPLTYNDSTYLPIRAISSLYEVPILWDGINNSIYLDSYGQVDLNACSITDTFDKQGLLEDNALLNKKIKVIYGNDIINFYDANKVRIYPISYQDTTYLPVRAIANLFECFVDYDYESNTVLLGDRDELNKKAQLYGDKYVLTEEGDSTEFNYLYTNYNDELQVTDEIEMTIAGFNDSICWGVNLYKEDPVTGRNLLEEELELATDEIEKISKDDELKKMLYTQQFNLDNCFPEYYDRPSGDYYYKIEYIYFVNGGETSGDNLAKTIEVIFNDEEPEEIILEETRDPQFVRFDYYQYDILNPVKIKIKIVDAYNDADVEGSVKSYISEITPCLVSNIPQGR